MKLLGGMSICLLLAGCNTIATGPGDSTSRGSEPVRIAAPETKPAAAPRDEFRASYEVGKLVVKEETPPVSLAPLQGRGSAPAFDVPAFDAAYETCRSQTQGSQKSLAMAAARAAANSDASHFEIDMSKAPEGKRANAAFASCMARKGYVNVR